MTMAPVERSRVEVYDLGLRDARSTEAMVRALLSAEGRVYADEANHRLVVYDRPEVHRRVAEALRKLEVAARNIRIRVRSNLARTSRSRGGSIVLDGSGIGVRGGATDSRSRAVSDQEILVISGGTASLRVAEEIPYPDWFWTWGLDHGLWTQGVRWRDVGTSLVVEPRVLGDGTLRVRLTPRFDYVIDRETLTTEVHSLSTEVVLREGEELDLGGVPLRDEEFRERFFVGLDDSRRTLRAQVTIRATVE